MAWWPPSWPSLPTFDFSLPSGLQRKFISYLLKRSLGPFLKPGQLDEQQIESQIGSGYVQIRDLEIDNTAVNTLLSGLPLELHEGYVGSVAARLPWPNPLTGDVRLSVRELHLTLHIVPWPEHSHDLTSDISESVTNMAESFVHEELEPDIEDELRRSIHESGNDIPGRIPGGIDPFDLTPGAQPASRTSREPIGITIFASLFQRLLQRFELDVEDIRVVLVHPGHSALAISLSEVRFGRVLDDGIVRNVHSDVDANSQVETRSMRFAGFNVVCCNLDTGVSHSSGDNPNKEGASSHSRSSSTVSPSDSDVEDPSQLLMSMSLATLPPPPPNFFSQLSDIDSSSLYQSAISTLPDTSAHESADSEQGASDALGQPSPSTQTQGPSLSPSLSSANFIPLATLSLSPIVVHVSVSVTPEAYHDTTEEGPPNTPPYESSPRSVSVSANMGALMFSLRPWSVCALLEITDAFIPRTSHIEERQSELTSPPSYTLPSSIFSEVAFNLSVRGIIVVVHPEGSTAEHDDELFAHPLSPPEFPSGYLRLFIDTINMHNTISSVRAQSNDRLQPLGRNLAFHVAVRLTIADLSLLAYLKPEGSQESYVLPVLISDPYLPSQYSLPDTPPIGRDENHEGLPTFPILNWLDPNNRSSQAKLSLWRTKPVVRGQHAYRSPSSVPAQTLSSTPEGSFSPGRDRHTLIRKTNAVSAYYDSHPAGHSSAHAVGPVEISFEPLHIFVGLGLLLGSGKEIQQSLPVLDFVQEVSERTSRMKAAKHDDRQDHDDAGRHGSPLAHVRQVYTETRSPPTYAQFLSPGMADESNASPIEEAGPHISVILRFPMTRIELINPPHMRGPSSVILDIHNISIQLPPDYPEVQERFSEGKPVFGMAISHLLVALSRTEQTGTSVVVCSGAQHVKNLHIFPLTDPAFHVQLSSFSGAQIIAIDVPSLHVEISKPLFDGLQIWADNVSRLIEHAFTQLPVKDNTQSSTTSHDPSLIGSHFFLNQDHSIPNVVSAEPVGAIIPSNNSGRVIINLKVAKASLRALLPRHDGNNLSTQALDLVISDVDILLETNPNGKDETVCTASILEITMVDHSIASTIPIFCAAPTKSNRPMAQVHLVSSVVPGSTAKESKINATLSDFVYNFFNTLWIDSFIEFAKPPPGVFEGVAPSVQTVVSLHIEDGSLRLFAPKHPGALVAHIGGFDFSTVLTGGAPTMSGDISIPLLSIFMADDFMSLDEQIRGKDLRIHRGAQFWMKSRYALIAELSHTIVRAERDVSSPLKFNVALDGLAVRLHLCADTGSALGSFFSSLSSIATSTSSASPSSTTSNAEDIGQSERVPGNVSDPSGTEGSQGLMHSLDEGAFKALPELGSAPDMVADDLPSNMDYLDESYSAAAGLRELTEDDLDDFGEASYPQADQDDTGVISRVAGETIRILQSGGLDIVENHFNVLPTIPEELSLEYEVDSFVKLNNIDITLLLYEGYDLSSTRKTIEQEVREMKRRLAKIRQLVAEGQKYDPTEVEPNTLLFNSVYVGLPEDAEGMEPDVLIAAIDEELKVDFDLETATQSSWQSLPARPQAKHTRTFTPSVERPKGDRSRRLTRASAPSIEFKLLGVNAEFDQYAPKENIASRIFVTVRDLEILDHVRTSTWRKFLTSLYSDSRGNIRETGSNMVRIELQNIRPIPDQPTEEVRLRAKLLPLRLHVDQDALDFLKKFFSFKDPAAEPQNAGSSKEAYLQRAEVFPVDLKLDYKPRRVDYRALREGRTIELMNFFHFDGAEMTLRHITLYGVTGWPRFFDMLNDLWTPDVKATQLADVISGVSPIRSVVNVGSGVADLVLLPIAQYRRDGRIIRGVQKGARAFVRSTAMEAVKLGARLATGTQVILEQTENVLGSQFNETLTAETVSTRDDAASDQALEESDDELSSDPVSRYANQPVNVREGVQVAYTSMRRNLHSAAQTILAVPMEVYERSGNEGAVRAVIRAVPIAVLRPMIGASEAVSKTLLGLQNSMDPNVRLENEAKYKHST